MALRYRLFNSKTREWGPPFNLCRPCLEKKRKLYEENERKLVFFGQNGIKCEECGA